MDRYTRREAAWLLGLSHQEARDLDACPRSSWTAPEDVDVALPTVVLRNDVHAAAARVSDRALAGGGDAREVLLTSAALSLRGRGWTLRAIALELDVSHSKVARRCSSRLAEVLEELGGAAVELESGVPACMACACRPRAQLRATARRSSLCWVCTPPERRGRLVASGALAMAA